MPDEDDLTLVDATKVKKLLGIKEDTFKSIKREPDFPKAIRPKKRAMYFLHEIKKWMLSLPRVK